MAKTVAALINTPEMVSARAKEIASSAGDPGFDAKCELLAKRAVECSVEATQVLAEQSHRAQILLGAAMIERRLDDAIALRVADGLEVRGPFQARVRCAQALGLMTPHMAKLAMGIAAVRNLAAHRIEANSFQQSDIRAKCEVLESVHAEGAAEKYLWGVLSVCVFLEHAIARVERVAKVYASQPTDHRIREMDALISDTLIHTTSSAVVVAG